MNNIDFLTVDDVLILQKNLVETYGGEEGLRDLGLLESALATPKAMFGGVFLHLDIYEMAAAYLFHLVKNHPFIDGNKRSGTMAAFVFLSINGLKLTATPNEFFDIVLGTAEGRFDKKQIAEFFRNNTQSNE